MTTNFVSSLSLTPDFGNVLANSSSASFFSGSFGMDGSIAFFPINLVSVPTSQWWFSLPTSFPCAVSNYNATLSIVCDSPPPFKSNSNQVLVFRTPANVQTAWTPFYNLVPTGNLSSCVVFVSFVGSFS